MPALRLSCHSWVFDDIPLRDAARRVRQMGFEWLDLGFGSHLDVADVVANPIGTGRQVRALLADEGVHLADAFPVLLYPSLNGPRARERLEQLRPLAACLAEAGSPSISVSPGVCHDDGFLASWTRAVVALIEFVGVARSYGLTPRAELHFDSVANTPARARQLLEAVPGLTLLFNPAHWEMQAIPYADVRPLMDLASHVHLRQARPGRIAASLDQGTLAIERIVGDLLGAGYAGVVCIGSAPRESDQNAHTWAASFQDRVSAPEQEVLGLRAQIQSAAG